MVEDGTVTTVSGSNKTTKLKFDNIRDLILVEDIRRKTSEEYSNYLLSVEDKDSGASFHATFCKEELEKLKLRSGKIHSRPIEEVISIGQIHEEGYHVGFGDQQWKVTKGSLVVARGNKRGSMYMVEVPSDGINTSIDGKGNATLWHQRLGHMSEKGMKILASKGRIRDLQKAIIGFCEPCVLRKQKKKWKAAVENETNLRVKCLKFDNGEEYSSREFIEYYDENEIRMLKTVSETPQ
nr:hypothetical protein [Tanacetum cinerariifolium]